MTEALASKRAIAASLQAIDALLPKFHVERAVHDALVAADHHGKLGPRERRFVKEATHGIALHLSLIEASLRAAGARADIAQDRSILQLCAWRVLVAGTPRDVVIAQVALPGPRRPRAISDAALGAAIRALPDPDALVREIADPATRIALRWSLPRILADELVALLGAGEAAIAAQALSEPAPIHLRANLAKIGRDALIAKLASEKITARPGTLSPWCAILEDRRGFFGSKSYAQGFAEVQDEGSQLLALLAGAEPGDTLLDLCAGAGGKTLALAPLVMPGGAIVASDKEMARLERLRERAKRAGVQRAIKIEKDPIGPFRRVLVDAPCSGSGAIRREPGARWRIDAKMLADLASVQSALIRRAAALVAPGGRLVYATCSFLRAENETIVEGLLADDPAWRLLPTPIAGMTSSYLRLWPHRHGTDAYFGAVLEKAV